MVSVHCDRFQKVPGLTLMAGIPEHTLSLETLSLYFKQEGSAGHPYIGTHPLRIRFPLEAEGSL